MFSSNNQHQKKLKHKISQDTQCTLSQSSDSKIKINIKLPEKLQRIVEQGKSKKHEQIIQHSEEESLLRSSNNRDQSLISVPHLSIRKSNDELFATKNFQNSINQISLSSQGVINSLKVLEKDIKDSIVSPVLIRLVSQQNQQNEVAQKDYNQYKLFGQKKQQSKPVTPQFHQHIDFENQPFLSVPYTKKKFNHSSSHAQLYRKPVSFSGNGNQSMQKVANSDKILQIHSKNIIQTKKEKKQQRVQKCVVKRNIQSIQELEMLRGEENFFIKEEKRLKLRDYLYQVKTSGKRVNEMKHQRVRKDQKQQVRNIQGSQVDKQKRISTNLKNKFRYELPKRDMVKIIQQQINSDLQETFDMIHKLSNELSEIMKFQQQPTNEEMVILYGLRRNIKQEINMKLNEALKSLVRDKKTLIESRQCLSSLQLKQPIFKKN